MANLTQIRSFGGIDADTDELLEECFENHIAFQDAINGSRFLIIGRKGSGKTAIFRKILRSKGTERSRLDIHSEIIPGTITISRNVMGFQTKNASSIAGNI